MTCGDMIVCMQQCSWGVKERLQKTPVLGGEIDARRLHSIVRSLGRGTRWLFLPRQLFTCVKADGED